MMQKNLFLIDFRLNFSTSVLIGTYYSYVYIVLYVHVYLLKVCTTFFYCYYCCFVRCYYCFFNACFGVGPFPISLAIQNGRFVKLFLLRSNFWALTFVETVTLTNSITQAFRRKCTPTLTFVHSFCFMISFQISQVSNTITYKFCILFVLQVFCLYMIQ